MTVSSELNRKTYAGNGSTTAFSTSPVIFYDTSDLMVYTTVDSTGVSTTLTEGVDYTVSGGNGATGTVTCTTAPASGSTLVIVRELPLTQEADLQNNDNSDAEVVETVFDKLTLMLQQVSASIGRALRLSDADVSGASTTVSGPTAGYFLRWKTPVTDGLESASITASGSIGVPVSVAEGGTGGTTAATARTGISAVGTTGDETIAGTKTFSGSVVFAGTTLAKDLIAGICEGRLTLTSGTPVTTADVTAAETIYFTPFRGNRVAVYDGTNWLLRAFTELSLDVPGVTGMHDIFLYDNAGTLTLEALVWTNDTTRATALTTQNGVLVKTGQTTRRYVGSFYSTTAGNGQTEDSAANRFLWSYYNRAEKYTSGAFTVDRTTASTSYVELNSEIRNNFIIGVAEFAVLSLMCGAYSNNSGVDVSSTSMAFDGTTAEDCFCREGGTSTQTCALSLNKFVAAGKHYSTLIGKVSGGTGTWSGGSAGGRTVLQTRLYC